MKNQAGAVSQRKARLVLAALVLAAGLEASSWARGAEDPEPADTEARAAVIELLVEGRDTVPIISSPKILEGGRPLAKLSEGELFLHPAVMSPTKSPELAAALRVDETIEDLADIALVIIERREFLGQLRRGVITRLWLSRGLPPFPTAQRPEKVLITPFGSDPPLNDLIVWPRASWSLEEFDQEGEETEGVSVLKVQWEEGHALLKPAEEVILAPTEWLLPVTLGRFETVAVGESPEELKAVEIDLGEAGFSTTVIVRYHGHLPLRTQP